VDTNQLKKYIHEGVELAKDDKVLQFVTNFKIRKNTPAWKRPKNYIPVIFGLAATLIMFKNTITGMFKPANTDTTATRDFDRG